MSLMVNGNATSSQGCVKFSLLLGCHGMNEFWIKKDQPALLLAPMEGVTDAPMREWMTERGAFTHTVTEFLRVLSTAYPFSVFKKHCPEWKNGYRTLAGKPVILQFLGGNVECLTENALIAVSMGSRAIDMNFGCPAPTVNRNDGGATLLKYPDRIRTIIRSLREALPKDISVSAKLRLGWDDIADIDRNFDAAVEGGADWITIHGRTRMQAYQRPIYWEPIGRVLRRSPVPVIANGDIWTLDDFKMCRDQTGSVHYMLGRGALSDPNLPFQVAHELGLPTKNEFLQPLPSNRPQEWLPLFQRFSEHCDQVFPDSSYTLSRMKQWIRLGCNGREIPWFNEIKRMQKVEDVLAAMAR